MILTTERGVSVITHATLSTATAFAASKAPTTTEPVVGSGVVRSGGNLMLTHFYGAGSDTNTGKARLWGWSRHHDVTNKSLLWVPTLLETLIDFTLSTPVGVTGAAITASHRFADTITITTGRTDSKVIGGTGNNLVVAMLCDILGFEYIEWELHNNSSATSVGASVRFL